MAEPCEHDRLNFDSDERGSGGELLLHINCAHCGTSAGMFVVASDLQWPEEDEEDDDGPPPTADEIALLERYEAASGNQVQGENILDSAGRLVGEYSDEMAREYLGLEAGEW